MKALGSVVVLLAALASADGRAQSTAVDEQRDLAQGWLYTVQWVSALAAKGYVLSHVCQHGDPEVWRRAVAAIDRIYQRCVPAQSAVARIVESKYALELLAKADGSKRAVAALAFERDRAKASDDFNTADRRQVCADPKTRSWIESGYVDPQDNREWFDRTLPYRLGTDPSLVEQPCGEFAAQEDPR